jgi:hypothetical protein
VEGIEPRISGAREGGRRREGGRTRQDSESGRACVFRPVILVGLQRPVCSLVLVRALSSNGVIDEAIVTYLDLCFS